MFAIDDKSQFEEAWASLISKFSLEDNSWMKYMYEIKEKWTWCCMKDFVTIGIVVHKLVKVSMWILLQTQVFVLMNSSKVLKRLLQYNEMKCEYEAGEKKPRLIVQSSPILRQVAQIYTPPVLELFQEQFDFFFATCISS